MNRLRWRLLATHVPANGAGGGMVRYTVEIAAALERHPDVQLSVVTSAEGRGYFADLLGSTERVQAMPSLPVAARSVLERLGWSQMKGGPYDVLQGTKHLLPRRSSALRVLTVHDMLPYDRPADFGLMKRALLRGPYAASIRDGDLLACVSKATRDRLLRRFPEVAPRAEVISLAVSSALLRSESRPVPTLEAVPFALVVGDSSHRKNLGFVVDLWQQVRLRVPGAVLAVAGPPSWAGSSWGTAFERLRREGAVQALGRIDDDQLRWCYQHAVIALCPSVLEGFGLPAIEALTFGAPVITSTDPALCEASGDDATHLSTEEPASWVDATVAAFGQGRPDRLAREPRTWDEVAEDTVRAIQRRARLAAR